MNESENVYTKVAQAVIRLVGFALIVTSLLLYLDDLRLYLSQQPLSNRGVLVLKAMPFVIGVILFCVSRPLAERLTKDLD
jgi:hypothetical protein